MASQGRDQQEAQQKSQQGSFSGALKNLGFTNRLLGNANATKGGNLHVKTTRLEPQDSIPEIVSSPTDVGIFDGGHQGEKVTWAKFFESGKTRRASQDASAPAPPDSGAGKVPDK